MFSVILGNFEPGAGVAALGDAVSDMVSALVDVQRRDACGESIEDFDEDMLSRLREIDFDALEMRIVPLDGGRMRLDLRS